MGVKENLLMNYTRAVIHLRNQFNKGSMGLVFGAGLSKSFKIPTWKKLVEKISRDPAINGEELVRNVEKKFAMPYITQMLFEHFLRLQRDEDQENEALTSREKNAETLALWMNIFRMHLYSDVVGDINTALSNHPYLESYLKIIRNTHLTVTYNFDDFLEQALASTRTDDEKKESRGYESVTNAFLQFRSKNSIIYHPNGIVPRSHMEDPSDKFIFSEHSFADLLIDMFSGDYSIILNHLTKNTCLFIGLSLDDQMLRNMLRQAARLNPGQYHYMVYYLEPDETIDFIRMEAIRRTNFKVYNVITLFLKDEEIKELAHFIVMEEEDFCEFSKVNNTRYKYIFYITGPLGVGKTTAVSHFRNLETFDEWSETRPDFLGIPWEELTDEEKEKANNWIFTQFHFKDKKIRRLKSGICVLDRSPLDPLAFTPENEWALKAKKILSVLVPGGADWRVQSGCVILLLGDEKELSIRMKLSNRRGYTHDKLKKMGETLKQCYGAYGVREVETSGVSLEEVLQRIAEIIHLDDYIEMEIHDRLERIGKEGKECIE